jgi:hypothetical protein
LDILRYPRQQRFRLNFHRFLSCAGSHTCTGRGPYSCTNAGSLTAARRGADQRTQGGTAADLGHI